MNSLTAKKTANDKSVQDFKNLGENNGNEKWRKKNANMLISFLVFFF